MESKHLSRQNALISHRGQIFKRDPLFFIIQDCGNQRKVLYLKKVLLVIIFLSLIKAHVRILVKLKLKQNQSINKLFL